MFALLFLQMWTNMFILYNEKKALKAPLYIFVYFWTVFRNHCTLYIYFTQCIGQKITIVMPYKLLLTRLAITWQGLLKSCVRFLQEVQQWIARTFTRYQLINCYFIHQRLVLIFFERNKPVSDLLTWFFFRYNCLIFCRVIT
jgi:hypothetical protein